MLVLALCGALGGASLPAQGRPAFTLTLPGPASLAVEGPVIRASGMLSGAAMRDLLASGFPARFHFAVELWSLGRWFNDLERRLEYDAFVRYNALDKVYEVFQVVNGSRLDLGRHTTVELAEAAVARPTRVPITATHTDRRQYYQATLTVEVLSLSDLDEVDRWLKGELAPAISGQRNPGTALARGIRTLTARLLGGEKREYEDRTPAFVVP